MSQQCGEWVRAAPPCVQGTGSPLLCQCVGLWMELGSPGSACLPARRPRCWRAAQPVPTSVLRALLVFGSLLGTVTVAVGSLHTSPWFSPTAFPLHEESLCSPVCFLGGETEAGGREVAEPTPDPRHLQARSHASPQVVFSCQAMPRARGKRGHPRTQPTAVSARGTGAARLLLPPPGASLAWGCGAAVCSGGCRAARWRSCQWWCWCQWWPQWQ